MDTKDLYWETHILISIVAKISIHALEQRLNATDANVSGLQFAIMRALSVDEHTISELSSRFMLDPSTLVPAVDALERKGFAKRGKDPKDRRRIPLSLTRQGIKFIESVSMVNEDDPLFQSINLLDEQQRHLLVVILRQLVINMPEGEKILEKVLSRIHLHSRRESALA